MSYFNQSKFSEPDNINNKNLSNFKFMSLQAPNKYFFKKSKQSNMEEQKYEESSEL